MVVVEASLLCGLAMVMDARSLGPKGPLPIPYEKGLPCWVLKKCLWMPWAGQCVSHWERGLLIGEAEPKRTQSCPIFQAPTPSTLLPAIEGLEKLGFLLRTVYLLYMLIS